MVCNLQDQKRDSVLGGEEVDYWALQSVCVKGEGDKWRRVRVKVMDQIQTCLKHTSALHKTRHLLSFRALSCMESLRISSQRRNT
jgi:hypothetical protein